MLEPGAAAAASQRLVVSMRLTGEQTHPVASRRRLTTTLATRAVAVALIVLLGAPSASTGEVQRRAAGSRFACVGRKSPHVPCHFSTPSGNVRCLWTPKPNNVACVAVATGRAYRLRPTGRARSIHLTLHRRGQILPTNQQILFPGSLSCHDSRTTMTCNQDFALGAFTLPPRAHTAH
jgi:hypothetical protein